MISPVCRLGGGDSGSGGPAAPEASRSPGGGVPREDAPPAPPPRLPEGTAPAEVCRLQNGQSAGAAGEEEEMKHQRRVGGLSMMVDVGQDTLAWTQSGPGGGAVLFERVTGKKRTDAPPVHTNIFVLQTGFFQDVFFLISLKLQLRRDLEILSSLKKKNSQADISPFWPLSRILHKFIYMFGNDSDINVLK